jgi:dethiobiotin synthetase
MRGLFVTGTDTDVGKTVICGLMAAYLRQSGDRVVTQKWVQTGCTGFSEDIECHLRFMGIERGDLGVDERLVCPYIFPLAASAHLAAEAAGQTIDPEHIKACYGTLAERYDRVLVEGLGGAAVPYSRAGLVLDLVVDLRLPVLVVVQNKLGAINHTLLAVEALLQRGLSILGLVFNDCPGQDPQVTADNPRICAELTGQPCLGTLPWQRDHRGLKDLFLPLGKAIDRAWQK